MTRKSRKKFDDRFPSLRLRELLARPIISTARIESATMRGMLKTIGRKKANVLIIGIGEKRTAVSAKTVYDFLATVDGEVLQLVSDNGGVFLNHSRGKAFFREFALGNKGEIASVLL